MPNWASLMWNSAVKAGPRGIMIIKSRMLVNWMPASVISSQRSRFELKVMGMGSKKMGNRDGGQPLYHPGRCDNFRF